MNWIPEVHVTNLLDEERPEAVTAGKQVAIRFYSDPRFSLSLSKEESHALRASLDQHQLRVESVRLPLHGPVHLGTQDADQHKEAITQVSTCLDCCRQIGAKILVVEPFSVGNDQTSGQVGYAQGLNKLNTALDELRFIAEKAGVFLAIAAPFDNGLLSPVEVRELVDAHMHTWVGVQLEYDACKATGCPADWLNILGRRVLGITLGTSLESLPEDVLDMIRKTGFDGPIVVSA